VDSFCFLGDIMSQAVAIQELARQIRQGTLQLLAAAQPEWLTWAPPGTSNHILWHAGHALWLQDVLCLEPLTGRSSLPAGWEQTFGMNCRPVKNTAHWPTREEISSLLNSQFDQIHAALDAAGEAALSKIVNARGDTLAGRIIHGFHDEAKHQGEMHLLTKLCRDRAV
jgi:hypothetical protein